MPIDDERTHRGDTVPAPVPSEQEVWLGLLVGQMPAVLWSLDRGLRFTSSLGAGLVGLGLAADQVVGMHLHDYFQTDDPSVVSLAAHHRALAGESVTFEQEWEGRIFESHVAPLRTSGGEITGVIGLALDVTERRRAERQVEDQNQILRRVAAGEGLGESLAFLALTVERHLPGALCAVLLLDDDGQLRLGAAPSLPDGYGPAVETLAPAVWPDTFAPWTDGAAGAPDLVCAALRELAATHGLAASWTVPIRSGGGAVLGLLAIHRQASPAPAAGEVQAVQGAAALAAIALEAARARELLVHHALHDPLTGLPNRTLFLDRLEMAMRRSRRRAAYSYAVLFVDLDGFKLINDSLGHMVGDELLQGIAGRLRRALRPGDTVARLGGDEFALLLEELAADEQAVEVAVRLQRDFAAAFELGGHEVYSSVSIGIALASASYQRPEEILRDADTAMYRAKLEGRARHAVFAPAMHQRAMSRLKIESAMRRAVQRREFLVYYQPIVRLGDGALVGFEALLRWRHPELGLLLPESFLRAAADTGVLSELGAWVLGEACRQLDVWRKGAAADHDLQLYVNLHPQQIEPRALAETVAQQLSGSGLAAAALHLEVTEGALLRGAGATLRTLRELRALGVGLCLDDFGTGFSSLSHLVRFPVSTLKVDRSFVRGVTQKRQRMIVESLVALAHGLELEVIAEGIETATQHAVLRRLGCNLGQGYHFSRPVDTATAEALLLRPPWKAR